MSARFRLLFVHIGTHQYFDPSRGELGLEVTADNREAASYFGGRLAMAMSLRDDYIALQGVEELPDAPEEKPDGENVV